ncbi:hypothetical protein MKX03_007043 [Papaver bracteatum]|nr:hypothetical protein MKX03_007043 [Papaver bracteatum]
MASIISFTFRESVEDVEYKGNEKKVKSKNLRGLCSLLECNKEFHLQEFLCDRLPHEPQKFDPSRFEVAPRPNTFMPFGNGVHSCPWNELAKVEILILLHLLITKFRWEVIGSQSGMPSGLGPFQC